MGRPSWSTRRQEWALAPPRAGSARAASRSARRRASLDQRDRRAGTLRSESTGAASPACPPGPDTAAAGRGTASAAPPARAGASRTAVRAMRAVERKRSPGGRRLTGAWGRARGAVGGLGLEGGAEEGPHVGQALVHGLLALGVAVEQRLEEGQVGEVAEHGPEGGEDELLRVVAPEPPGVHLLLEEPGGVL